MNRINELRFKCAIPDFVGLRMIKDTHKYPHLKITLGINFIHLNLKAHTHIVIGISLTNHII